LWKAGRNRLLPAGVTVMGERRRGGAIVV